jgi:hypothetical protein
MATTASASDDGQDPVAVLKDTQYAYLGIDGEGEHHHYNRDEGVIYLTTGKYTDFVPEGTVLYHYEIHGELVEKHEIGPPESLEAWIKHVANKRGWEDFNEPPLIPLDGLF